MAIETGFLCIPTLVSEEGGAHACLILRPREWKLIWGRNKIFTVGLGYELESTLCSKQVIRIHKLCKQKWLS